MRLRGICGVDEKDWLRLLRTIGLNLPHTESGCDRNWTGHGNLERLYGCEETKAPISTYGIQ
ncbi:hypothetical protein IQ268_04270 [Oculatella sp. LEGE 06141]|uniref:hypothetical protein n=1 Tax=Oculatella sp. LEGE 06141 TaxID=1828648 RepID=UPI001881BD88|nr:hypothetical protein [Oculatella sp. LEGE 06141]MBE9177796.1 hypothetical protein [Oculatella sp. LEGE 06141]